MLCTKSREVASSALTVSAGQLLRMKKESISLAVIAAVLYSRMEDTVSSPTVLLESVMSSPKIVSDEPP